MKRYENQDNINIWIEKELKKDFKEEINSDGLYENMTDFLTQIIQSYVKHRRKGKGNQ